MIIYLGLPLPTASSDLPKTRRAAAWFCFGLASDGVYMCPACYQPGGSLLHCLSTLTGKSRRFISVALAWESPPPDVIRHPALRSPDFPHLTPFGIVSRDHLTHSVWDFIIERGECKGKREINLYNSFTTDRSIREYNYGKRIPGRNTMSKILVAEDELAINKLICMNLSITGYETVSMQNGQEVLDYLAAGGLADLAIVDVMMPKVDGFSLLSPLKQKSIPVIYLTARGDLESKLKGLTGGAEDYMVKPFEMLELLVRIDMVLKRTGKSEEIISLGCITLNMKKRTVQKSGENISLTPMEYDLLCVLAKNRNIALNREKLLREIWGVDFEGETRTVDVHVAALRRKTGLHIVSVPKIGYRLEVDEA